MRIQNVLVNYYFLQSICITVCFSNHFQMQDDLQQVVNKRKEFSKWMEQDLKWKHPRVWSCSDRETGTVFPFYVSLSFCFFFVCSFFCCCFFALYFFGRTSAWWSQKTKRGSAYIVAEVLGTAKHKKMIFFSNKHSKAIWLWLTDRSFRSVFCNK